MDEKDHEIASSRHLSKNATYEATVSGGRKVQVLDKGNLVAAEDPEVRMIASKYGDPDELLRPLNRRVIPGSNAPGSYEEYAKDPWGFHVKELAEVKAGTHKYLVKLDHCY